MILTQIWPIDLKLTGSTTASQNRFGYNSSQRGATTLPRAPDMEPWGVDVV